MGSRVYGLKLEPSCVNHIISVKNKLSILINPVNDTYIVKIGRFWTALVDRFLSWIGRLQGALIETEAQNGNLQSKEG